MMYVSVNPDLFMLSHTRGKMSFSQAFFQLGLKKKDECAGSYFCNLKFIISIIFHFKQLPLISVLQKLKINNSVKFPANKKNICRKR